MEKFIPLAKAFKDSYKKGEYLSVEEFMQGEAIVEVIVLLNRIATVNKWTSQ